MIKAVKRPTRKTVLATTKTIAVIKNGHTDEELDEMSDCWDNHTGPYLTLAQVLTIEKAKASTNDGQCTMGNELI